MVRAVSAHTGATISIRTVEDFLALPPDRRAVALREFAAWCRVHDDMEPLAAALADAGISLGAKRDTFEWIDDDKGQFRADVKIVGPIPAPPAGETPA